MKPGPPRGATETLAVTVTDDMAALVAGQRVHDVYGTQAMAGHMEEVCRNLLHPHLEEGEEGVGQHLDLTHRAPVPIGAEIELVATVAQVNAQRLVCEVIVRRGGRMVARGSYEQRIVRSQELAAEIADAQAEVT